MYKIIKKELVRVRPLWLTKLLLHLSPVVYAPFSSRKEAKEQLRVIADKVKELNIVSSRPGMSVNQDDSSLSILKKTGNPYIIFSITNK